MGKVAPGSEPRELIKARNYSLVVCGVYELGHTKGQYGPQHQYMVIFSVHHRTKGTPMRDSRGNVHTIAEFVNFSLGSAAKPKPLLELFSAVNGGRSYSDDEIKKGGPLFDIETLLDGVCEGKVVHKIRTNGTVGANIESFSPLVTDDPDDPITAPESLLDSFYWDIPEPWDGSIPDRVPPFVAGFIRKSDEYQKATRGGNGQRKPAGATVPADDDDKEDDGSEVDNDIPF